MERYFSYDQTLNIGELVVHGGIPADFKLVGPGKLPDRELSFTQREELRTGADMGEGVLDIRKRIGSVVAGYRFDVTPRGRALLDAIHGVADGISRALAVAVVAPDGTIETAITYESVAKVPALPDPNLLEAVRLGMVMLGVPPETFEKTVSRLPSPCALDSLFVYGSLRYGEPSHRIAKPEQVQSVGSGTVDGDLRDGGEYPFLILPTRDRDPSSSVRGDLVSYRPGEIPLAELDGYEEFDGYAEMEESLFVRTVLPVRVIEAMSAGTLGPVAKAADAWVYVSMDPRSDLPRVPFGDWSRRKR